MSTPLQLRTIRVSTTPYRSSTPPQSLRLAARNCISRSPIHSSSWSKVARIVQSRTMYGDELVAGGGPLGTYGDLWDKRVTKRRGRDREGSFLPHSCSRPSPPRKPLFSCPSYCSTFPSSRPPFFLLSLQTLAPLTISVLLSSIPSSPPSSLAIQGKPLYHSFTLFVCWFLL